MDINLDETMAIWPRPGPHSLPKYEYPFITHIPPPSITPDALGSYRIRLLLRAPTIRKQIRAKIESNVIPSHWNLRADDLANLLRTLAGSDEFLDPGVVDMLLFDPQLPEKVKEANGYLLLLLVREELYDCITREYEARMGVARRWMDRFRELGLHV